MYGTLRIGATSRGKTRLHLQARSVSTDASKGGGRLLVTAVSTKGTQPRPWRLVESCVDSGRQWLQQVLGQSYDPTTDQEIGDGPLDKLSFCTWTSLGESSSALCQTPPYLDTRLIPNDVLAATRPTLQNLRSLCQSLASSGLPVQSFLIDAGWQSISSLPDTGNIGSDTIQRKLIGFEPYNGLGGSLSEVVRMVREDLPVVRDVGVWMT